MGMRKLLLIIIGFICLQAEAQLPMHKLIRKKASSSPFVADSAQFTFTWNSPSLEPAESGWLQIQPNPNAAILTGSQNGYDISTIDTGDANWNDNGTSASAGMVTENTANGVFTANVLSGYFFHASTSFPSGSNIRITPPDLNGLYDIYIASNRPTVTDNRQTKFRMIDGVGTRTRNNVNSAPSTAVSNDSTSQVISGGTVIKFANVRPGGSPILISVAGETGFTFGYINAIKIVRKEDL